MQYKNILTSRILEGDQQKSRKWLASKFVILWLTSQKTAAPHPTPNRPRGAHVLDRSF